MRSGRRDHLYLARGQGVSQVRWRHRVGDQVVGGAQLRHLGKEPAAELGRVGEDHHAGPRARSSPASWRPRRGYGSGSAALLETALMMAKLKPENTLRFAWW
jgi:hypothetical protein